MNANHSLLPRNEGTITLLLAPGQHSAGTERCCDPLTTSDPSETNRLVVTYTSPDVWIQQWRRQTDEVPAELGLIAVGEQTRSTATQADLGTPVPARVPGQPVLTTVTNPTNLTGLGTAIDLYLEMWTGTAEQTVLCIDSLTALLQHVDVRRACEFLQFLRERVRPLEVTAHVHCDPAVYPEPTIERLHPLFDAVHEESTTAGAPEPLALDEVLHLLQAARRRAILRVLDDADDYVTLDALATAIAIRETEPTLSVDASEAADRIVLALQQAHLPKLAEKDIVGYNREQQLVWAGPQFSHVWSALTRLESTDSDDDRTE